LLFSAGRSAGDLDQASAQVADVFEDGRAWGVVLDALDVPSVGSLAVP
jgi:hypothetical protein